MWTSVKAQLDKSLHRDHGSKHQFSKGFIMGHIIYPFGLENTAQVNGKYSTNLLPTLRLIKLNDTHALVDVDISNQFANIHSQLQSEDVLLG